MGAVGSIFRKRHFVKIERVPSRSELKVHIPDTRREDRGK